MQNIDFAVFFLGTKQSYSDPQDLTEIIREALREKKSIADSKNDTDSDNVKERNKI